MSKKLIGGGIVLALVLAAGAYFMLSGGNYEKGYRYIGIETEFGTMEVKLYNSTPQHRDNMVKLASEGFYDDLLFHRVIQSFMAQGGDPESRGADPNKPLGQGGPGYTIPAEIGALHVKGALSAARTSDNVNPQKRSSGSQFYVVQGAPMNDAELAQVEQNRGFKYTDAQRDLYKTLGGTPFLDNEYTVFGEVVKGLDLIDKICAVQTKAGDRPVEDLKMKVWVIK
ncbi:MAG: peptidylprolyl isomerase [Bacteroidota bacterium]